jgi:tetratricopeptide (TPR) repeat protein
VRLGAWIAILALAAGCSDGTSPVDRLKARVQLKKGNLSYQAGEYKDAIRSYDRALRYAPQLAAACLNRAYSQEALSRVGGSPQERQSLATEAVSSFETYLSLIDRGAVGSDPHAPGRERIEEHILTLLLDSQQIDKAISHLQERYQKDPSDASALEVLSRLEMERGNLDEAMGWQRKRVEAKPQSPDAQYSLGAFAWLMSYRDTGMDLGKRTGLLDEGMEALRRALELRPDDFETLIYINLLYLEMAKYAVEETARSEFTAQAKTFRERALALRKTAPAAGGTEPLPAGAQGAGAPDSTQQGTETP